MHINTFRMFSKHFSLAATQSLTPSWFGEISRKNGKVLSSTKKTEKWDFFLSSVSLAVKMWVSDLTLFWANEPPTSILEWFMQISRSQSGNHSRSSSIGGKGCIQFGSSDTTSDPMAITVPTTLYYGHEG